LKDKIVTKELARSLLKDKGTEINSIVADSYKKSLMSRKQNYVNQDDTMQLYSKKESFLV